MGQISLTVPAGGSPRGTAEASINSDLNTIQTVINGNLDDTNLASPNSSVRHLLLQGTGVLGPGFFTANYIFLPAGGIPITSGTLGASGVHLWPGDSGIAGQPVDFTVPNKSTFLRVRGSVVSTGSTSVSVYLCLFQVTAVVGDGTGNISYTFSTPFMQTLATTPTTGSMAAVESTPSAMPAANFYALGVSLAGTIPAGVAVWCSAQLYGYNA